MPSAVSLVDQYLATLEGASPATQRQRSWALRELLAFAAERRGDVFDPELLAAWLTAAVEAQPPASLPGLRARASASRALTRHAEATGAIPPDTSATLATALRLPAPPPGPERELSPVRHLLTLAHPDHHPAGVMPAVWMRFCAHVQLLAVTGAREDVIAHLTLDDVAGGRLDAELSLDGREHVLPSATRTALTAWLGARTSLVATLRGGAPTALWLRARPSSDRRTGALRPAGLPLSQRGLRLAYDATVDVLELTTPQIHGVLMKDIRAHALLTTPH